MTEEVVLKVKGLGKRFKIYPHPRSRIKEWLSLGTWSGHKEFWALHDVSFVLKRGESLALIGPNGAGKSTLLKILTGILYSTEGNYDVKGRVLSLLELNTGFNPELTGRQNVYYSAQLLGFPETYLQERLADIEAFAELGEFFDRPFKFYSSGMQARLGFSLFAFLECDVLIIDEVLAVGDVFFRQKCFARLEELKKQQVATILVTHSMSVVQEYCQRAIVLNKGRILFQGPSSGAVRHYLELEQRHTESKLLLERDGALTENAVTKLEQKKEMVNMSLFWPASDAFFDLSKAVVSNGRWARCLGVALCDEDGQACQIFEQGQWAYFYYEFEVLQNIGVPIASLTIRNDRNILIHGKTTLQQRPRPSLPGVPEGSKIRFRHSVKLDITPGDYTVRIGLAMMDCEDYSNAESLSHQEISAKTVALANADKVAIFS